MLSYQHIYHAGNLADVHKHALLAWMLAYLTRKDKPLSYIETHAGRGLYDLSGPEGLKTGEAAAGIRLAESWFDAGHPYRQRLAEVRAQFGPDAYPGSPMIAALGLRDGDVLHLAELHPQEFHGLETTLKYWGAHLHFRDGFETALAVCPPTPRRGLMLIDPSYEVKADYDRIPGLIGQIARKWNVGVISLWYPILAEALHEPMVAALQATFSAGLTSEVKFPPAKTGHRMLGSGLFTVNPPFGLAEEAARLANLFANHRN